VRISRRSVVAGMAAAAGSRKLRALTRLAQNAAASTTQVATSAERNLAQGPFQPTWDSLKQGYKTPAWFRDAKFGMWAHWTAQCVPEQGDWYARNMYIQGSKQNLYHVAHYGHPSKVGFKDIDHMWGAQNWQPEYLMNLYVKGGAKYFMGLANHHDNFDCYDSTYQNWNSVKIGPKKDIIGTWAKVAREHGLRFGASNHSSHAWHWFQPAFGYDPVGAMAGIRYDGYTAAGEGKGQWWDGFDPQELYVGPSFVLPSDMTTEKQAADWHKAVDGHWHEDPPQYYPGFTNSWFLRTRELVDKYDLDFLYFDDTELPFEQTGLDVVADFYNRNIGKRKGQLEALVFGKGFKPEHLGAATLDIERGRSNDILPLPWQTDTCIGDWHYNIEAFTQHRYKTAKAVIQLLADIVAKNGNLMLNIPLKGDGTIDSDELAVLNELGTWFPANGEAIYGTRPFKIAGEGPPDIVSTGNFNESKGRPYTSEDIRFTVKDGRLYAIAMAWPASGKVQIKTLAKGSALFPGEVVKVELLGAAGGLKFERTADALEVTLPGRQPSELAFALRVTPANLSMLQTG